MSNMEIGVFIGLAVGGVFGFLLGLWLPLAMRDRVRGR